MRKKRPVFGCTFRDKLIWIDQSEDREPNGGKITAHPITNHKSVATPRGWWEGSGNFKSIHCNFAAALPPCGFLFYEFFSWLSFQWIYTVYLHTEVENNMFQLESKIHHTNSIWSENITSDEKNKLYILVRYLQRLCSVLWDTSGM